MDDTNSSQGYSLSSGTDSETDALQSGGKMQVFIENIGGITNEERTITPGITPLVGENATNRTSFLTAVMAGLGSKRDDLISVNTETESEEGTVKLRAAGETFTRTVSTDTTGRTVMTGTPLVESSDTAELLDLYAFLHGNNEVRNTVESNGDLYNVLMRPVDTSKIERERNRKKNKKEELEKELHEIQQNKKEVSGVEHEIERKRERESELQEERDDIQTRIQSLERDIESVRKQEQSEPNEEIEELEEKRQEIKTTIEELEEEKSRQSARLNRFEQEREHQKEKLRSLLDEATDLISSEGTPAVEKITDGTTDTSSHSKTCENKFGTTIDSLESRIKEIKKEKREIEQERYQLQEVRTNIDDLIDIAKQAADEKIKIEKTAGERLSDDALDGPITFSTDDADQEASRDDSNAHLTDELTGTEQDKQRSSRQCLVCGQSIEGKTIGDVVSQYESIRKEIADQIDRIDDRIESLQKNITTGQRRIKKAEELKGNLAKAQEEITELDDRIGDEKGKLETYDERIEQKRGDLEEIESELNQIALQMEADTDSDRSKREQEIESLQTRISERTEELVEKKSEINNLEAEIETLETKHEELRAQADREEQIKTNLERIENELDDLLGMVNTKEQALAERFNNHMELVVDRLGFSNIERVWIEHTNSTGERKTSLDKTGQFELHIVRKRDSGTAYECKLEHLSESERTVVGLVFALTGYLVHDVADVCPVVILDSIEMVDAERVAAFLSVLEELVDSRWNLIALLPDHVTESTNVVAEDIQEFVSQSEITIQ